MVVPADVSELPGQGALERSSGIVEPVVHQDAQPGPAQGAKKRRGAGRHNQPFQCRLSQTLVSPFVEGCGQSLVLMLSSSSPAVVAGAGFFSSTLEDNRPKRFTKLELRDEYCF